MARSPGSEFLFSMQIYGDSARGINIDSSSLSFSEFFFILIEIFELQEWLTTHWKAYFEIIIKSSLDRKEG